MTEQQPLTIGMLVFPRLTPLDILGPFEVLARAENCLCSLVWKSTTPIVGDTGLVITPTVDFASAPQYDVLVVPGGPGQNELMNDDEVLDFVRRQGEAAKWVTSVCTGSLVLAAAGLLNGYRATCHWLSIDYLALFGAIPVAERVVIDRNRITGAGVTSGLDFAFTLLSFIRGESAAKAVQLFMEYDPAPPFDSGHPRVADLDIVSKVKLQTSEMLAQREVACRRAARKLAPQKD